MPFPEATRTIYSKNPLTRVICQVRFPPILKIDSEIPTHFQELVRQNFPLYSEKDEIQNQVFGLNPGSPSEIIKQLSRSSASKNHEFSDEKSQFRINLTRTFLALSTSEYTRWEDFISKVSPVLEAFQSIYSPPFFSRIGLRYIDVFCRKKLGLEGVPWNELLAPQFLGLIASDIGSSVDNQESVSEVRLADEISRARIVSSFVIDMKSSDKCYQIDSDFFTPKRIAKNDVLSKFEFLHMRATRLIKWAITDKLKTAMEPMQL